MYQQALEIAERIMRRIDVLDGARITQGMRSAIASDLHSLAISLKPAFRRANMVAKVELLESALTDFSRPRADVPNALMRLHSVAYGVHMCAYNLANPREDNES